MQTQQIFGVSGGGMLYSAKGASVKSSDNSFDQLIQMSQNIGAANEASGQPAETKKDSAVSVTKEEPSEKPAEITSEKKDTTTTAENKPELKKAEGTEAATDTEAAERAATVLNRVAEAIRDILGLTEEELNGFMETLGITNLDLLQPETLQNLVLMANSEQDAVILLTDAQLLSQVNELISTVENLLQDAGITAEEMFAACDDAEFGALVEEALNRLEETVTTEETEESTDVEQATSKSTESKEETSFKVEIHTEGRETERDFNGRNTKESTDVEQFSNQFIQNLQQAADKIGEITGQKDLVQLVREIADQIMEKVRVSVTPETTSLEIVLTPEELGKVNLTVSAERDGTMKASFVTENELAREAIERNLVQFKEMLQEQGLKVDTIEVTVGNFEFDKNGQANESSQEEKRNHNGRFMTDEEIGQKEDTDQLAQHFMDGGESTVNYMA